MGKREVDPVLREQVNRLFEAIYANDVKSVREVARACPEVLKWETSPGTVFHIAAMSCDNVEMVKCFLDLGFDVDVSTNGTATPLWYAAQARGSDEVFKFLIERGANVNAGAGIWSTVLHCAANANRPRAVRLLLEHGADPGFEDEEGETPLALATRRKFEAVIQVLREFNAPMVGKPIKKKPAKVVEIDLTNAATKIETAARRAVRRFVKEHGKEEITAVALYGSGIHGFVWVGFDTGEFAGDVSGMKYNAFEEMEFPKWQEAYEYAEHIKLTTYNGRMKNIAGAGGTDDEVFQKPFLDLFVHVLKKLEAAKVFDRLKRAPKAQIGVEIMDGTHAKFWKLASARVSKE